MKKQLFSFVMMLALVIVTGNAMAAGDYAPALGTSSTYVVSGLSSGDGVAFSVNQITTAPGGTVGATMSAASPTADASGNASVTIEWLAAGTYNLWIVVTDQASGNCTNQRYRQVVVGSNSFNARIIALGTSTSTEYPSWTTASAKLTDCPTFSTGANFLVSSGADGSSYVFYRVDVLAENAGTHTWNFSVASPTDLEYYVGGVWISTAPTNIADATNSVLVRVTLANLPAGQTLAKTVTATENVGAGTVPDITPGDNVASIDINLMPDMSGVTFN